MCWGGTKGWYTVDCCWHLFTMCIPGPVFFIPGKRECTKVILRHTGITKCMAWCQNTQTAQRAFTCRRPKWWRLQWLLCNDCTVETGIAAARHTAAHLTLSTTASSGIARNSQLGFWFEAPRHRRCGKGTAPSPLRRVLGKWPYPSPEIYCFKNDWLWWNLSGLIDLLVSDKSG